MRNACTIVAIIGAGLPLVNGCRPQAKPQSFIRSNLEKAGEAVPKEHNFGKVPQLSTLRTRVFIENNTGEGLLVKNISKTCGCTEAYPSRLSVEPGKRLDVAIAMVASTTIGPLSSLVKVTTAGVVTGTIFTYEVSLKATVTSLLKLDTPTLEFGEYDLGRPVERVVNIERGDANVVWDTLRSEASQVDTELLQTGANAWTLKARVKRDLNRIGAVRGDIALYFITGETRVHEPLKVPFSAFIKSEFEIEPKTLFLGELQAGIPKQAVLKILSREGRPFTLTLPLDTPADIKLEIIEEAPAEKRIVITLLSSDRTERAISGKLHCKLDVGGSIYEVDVAYMGYFRDVGTVANGGIRR